MTKIMFVIISMVSCLLGNYNINDDVSADNISVQYENSNNKNTNLEFSYNSSITNTYFDIKFDSNYVNYSDAAEILTFCDNVRDSFIGFGFRENYMNQNGEKLEVHLNPNDNGKIAATTTFKRKLFSNKASCYITTYGYFELSSLFKETLVHEYFHTLQNNYNCGNEIGASKWFKEACATWAVYRYNNDCYDPYYFIKKYFLYDEKNISINEQSGYGASIFPLTLTMLYGNNIINEIYNELELHIYTFSFNDLKEVIDKCIKKYDENSSFDSVFNYISTSIVNYQKWDNGYFNNKLDNEVFDDYYCPDLLSFESKVSKKISGYTSNYFEIVLPNIVKKHDISTTVSIDSKNANVYLYTIDKNDSNNIIKLEESNSNEYKYVFTSFGSSIYKAYVIITSNNFDTKNYSISLNYLNHSFKGHYCEYCSLYNENHKYNNSYESIDKTYHYALCSCGLKEKQSHVVSSTTTGFKKYCLLCGALANVGIVQFDTILLNESSYIANNGVIVLSERDLIVFQELNYDLDELIKELF